MMSEHAVALSDARASEWSALSPRAQAAAKVAVLLAVTVAAYHYSLASLAQTLTSDTPLAYLALVPVFALAIVWYKRIPATPEPAIFDRQLDYLLGIPLLAASLFAAFVLPARFGAMAWVNRVDLLFLPVFVTGATILLFGTRVAWRQKAALAYLFLAWPWLYTTLLGSALGGLRNLTLRALEVLVRVVPVARPVGSSTSGGLFEVVHHGVAFPISFVTACSGVDGMVGFLLLGVALLTVVEGRPTRKLAWLAVGLVLAWIANLVRLVLIFGVGALEGPHVAMDVLHPVAGFVFFALALAAMTALMRPFGLHFSARPKAPGRAAGPAGTAGRAVVAATLMLLVAAVSVASGVGELRQFNPVADAAGEPRLSSFLVSPAAPSGWSAVFETEYQSSKTLFGPTSRWFRYLFAPTSSKRAHAVDALPVTADVIDESGLGGFNVYGITACYSFHGYHLRDVAAVDLGNGIRGQALSYAGGRSQQDWSLVWWVWPVRTGDGTRYERVVLYLQNTKGADLDQRLARNRAFLVSFGSEIVAAQRAHHDFDVAVTTMAAPNLTGRTLLEQAKHKVSRPLSPTAQHDAFWKAYFARRHDAAKGTTGG